MSEVNFSAINLGQKPKDNIEVVVYLDITNPDTPTVLSPEEEAVMSFWKVEGSIIPIKSYWKHPNWTLSQVIELNCYVDRMIQGRSQRVFDINAMTMARIKVLLSSWELDKIDPCWKLEFEPSVDAKDVKILTDNCMRMIGKITPSGLVTAMYNKMYLKFFVEESAVVKSFLQKKLEEDEKKMLSESQSTSEKSPN